MLDLIVTWVIPIWTIAVVLGCYFALKEQQSQ